VDLWKYRPFQEDAMGNSTGRARLGRGDRRRNEKLARLRAVVRRDLAVVAVDLAKARQAVAVMDHDSRVLGRRMFACSPWGLGQALAWAEDLAVEHGFEGVAAAFEPTGHRWKPLLALCRDRGIGVVCVQPLLVHRGREAEDFTRDRSDLKDATIIGRLAVELRCYLPYALEGQWARLRHLGARRHELVVRATAARQTLQALVEVCWPAALAAAAKPLDSLTWRACMTVSCDPTVVAGMRWRDYERRVHKALPAQGTTRLTRRIARAVWQSARDPGGIAGERAGAAERAGSARDDWDHARGLLVEVEARMVGVLDALGLTGLVCSIDGVSAVGAAAILAETGDPSRYDSGRTWVKHAGLAPRDNESGTFHGATKVSGRGRPLLRTAAWRVVWGALPHNAVYAARYRHLTGRDHNRLNDGRARAAIAAALLRQLHAVCTRRVAWDADTAAGITARHEEVVVPAA
jgi:transposase